MRKATIESFVDLGFALVLNQKEGLNPIREVVFALCDRAF